MKRISLWIGRVAVPVAILLVAAAVDAAGEERTVHLTVQVLDDAGNPVSGAHVNIYQSHLWMFRHGVVTPADYQPKTDANGLAREEIRATSGEKLDLGIEVAREDMEAETRNLDLGTDFPARPPLVPFTLKRKSEAGAGSIINVTIEVENMEHDNVGGAGIIIWDTSLGTGTGRFPGTTDANGRATIPVLYGGADAEETVEVQASRNGYKQGKKHISLYRKDVGKTVLGGKVVLEKMTQGSAETKVTVTVIDSKKPSPVREAEVILDNGTTGFYSEKTNGDGVATFSVGQIGTFKVRISQDNYLPGTGEIRLLHGQAEAPPVTFKLEPKTTKDQGEDTIKITVLGKDESDEKSKPAPIKGAYVKAGTISAATDEGGLATLTAAFAENQEVTVQANGYKTKTQNVRVNKILHMSAGRGKTTFTLDPELSDTSPVRLQIEVRDVSGKPIPNALVELLTLSGERAGGDPTDAAGNLTFNSSDFEGDLSEVRKGLLLKVVATGYQLIEHRSVPADMLKPSTKTSEFLVPMERDWSGLEKELAALEARVKAWSAERSAAVSKAGEDAFIDKALTTRKHAEQTGKEIEAAKEAFGITTNPGGATLTRCKKAAELKQDIELCEAEANQKAEEMKRLLDAAGNVAETCLAAGDADVIRANYKDAIKLIAKIGVLNKKAVKDRDELLKLTQETSAATKSLAELDAKLASIGEDKKTAEDNARKAAEQYRRISDGVNGSNAKRIALYSDFATLKNKYNVNEVAPPGPIQTRLDAIENTLNPRNSVPNEGGKPKQVPESVASAAGVIEGVQGQAEKFIARYRAGGCDIDTMDEVVNGLNTTLTNATGEIGMAGDIMTKATACENKFKDEVEVPDLSTLNDLGAMMKAADSVGMVLKPAATGANPPAGSQRLFGPQNPLAKSKAKKGDTLTIIVYQKLVEKAATPSPAPVAVASASATPAEEYVEVPSVAAAANVGAMTKLLEAAGFTAVFNAATPQKKEDELKYAGQDITGRVKRSEMLQRGNRVIVLINQKWQSPPGATETPVPVAAAASSPGNGRKMPDLNGLTIEAASARLPAGVQIGSDEVGIRPPSKAEEALTIYHQYPPAGQTIGPDTTVSISRFGSFDSTVAASTPEPTPDSDSSLNSGPTDITNTTSGGSWKTRGHGAVVATPPPHKKPTPAPARKKSRTSNWWRQHGHDRPDYEVPNN